MIRYTIVDSHLNMTKRIREALAEFFEAVKGCGRDVAEFTADFCAKDFEKVFAVKWYEVMARDAGKIVGYIRCLRNPEDATRWYICEVHVRREYRRRGIAGQMYRKIIDVLGEYEDARVVSASVHADNVNSIKLHESLGFTDTGVACKFPGLCFEERETEYVRKIYKRLFIPDNLDYAIPKIMPLWKEYLKKHGKSVSDKADRERLVGILESALEEKCSFDTIWCGLEIVGFEYKDGRNKGFYMREENKEPDGKK